MPIEQLLASLRPGGRDFERLCKWLLENVPEYRSHLGSGTTGPVGVARDIGIDLVAEDHDGRLWAILHGTGDEGTEVNWNSVDHITSVGDPFEDPAAIIKTAFSRFNCH